MHRVIELCILTVCKKTVLSSVSVEFVDSCGYCDGTRISCRCTDGHKEYNRAAAEINAHTNAETNAFLCEYSAGARCVGWW
jgi:hypothetical protein